MIDLNPLSLWRRLLSLPNTSRTKTIAVAIIVSGVSAIVVSSTAVMLRPLQQANQLAERLARMDAMIAALPGMRDALDVSSADSLETLIVNLQTGTVARHIDPFSFDARAIATDPATSTALDAGIDLAGIGRRPDFAQIYILRRDDALQKVILPIYGQGYQSRIYAYLALESDLNTVAALTISEQGETPGLGTRIEEPAWQQLWPGKQIADESGTIMLAVVRGSATNEYEVDGITGATRTGNGITNMVQFWLGENGYGPALDRLRAGEF